jgi:hypothetical protein
MLKPRRLTTLWASTSCFTDSFTFFPALHTPEICSPFLALSIGTSVYLCLRSDVSSCLTALSNSAIAPNSSISAVWRCPLGSQVWCQSRHTAAPVALQNVSYLSLILSCLRPTDVVKSFNFASGVFTTETPDVAAKGIELSHSINYSL